MVWAHTLVHCELGWGQGGRRREKQGRQGLYLGCSLCLLASNAYDREDPCQQALLESFALTKNPVLL